MLVLKGLSGLHRTVQVQLLQYCWLGHSVQPWSTLCNIMNRSMPGLPVHHQLPEFTQTHVHRVGDAIQPFHPLSSPSPPAPISPSISVFSNESSLHMRWPKYWSFSFSISPSSEHPGLISFRMDWLANRGAQSMFFEWISNCMNLEAHELVEP